MTALRYSVSLAVTAQFCNILQSDRFGDRFPNTSNLLPLQIKQMYVSNGHRMRPWCLIPRTCAQLCFLHSNETHIDKKHKISDVGFDLTGDLAVSPDHSVRFLFLGLHSALSFSSCSSSSVAISLTVMDGTVLWFQVDDGT